MILKIKTFGIASDILGGKLVPVEISGDSVAYLRRALDQKYPKLSELNSLFIAVNHQYAADDMLLKESDEVAILPPVSGG